MSLKKTWLFLLFEFLLEFLSVLFRNRLWRQIFGLRLGSQYASIRDMKRIIQFHVSQGEKYYVAEGTDLPIVTQGKTLDELTSNIKEAVALHLEGENLSDFDLAPNPSILANFELPAEVHV